MLGIDRIHVRRDVYVGVFPGSISRTGAISPGSGKMATTDTMPEIPDVTTSADETCSACNHPWSAHDIIGRRFCAATLAGALDRGCVCPRQQ
jgi:hypothetical protein